MRVVLDRLTKAYGGNPVVNGVSLAVEDGEFFTLLGPSGCGKTTLLRMLAGFARPDSGDILFGGQSVRDVPPHRRETGMVFQNYALFPQLTIFENVAYGLRARKEPAADIRRKVADALEGVQLTGFEDRLPSQLSGGQQQRVALARALVIRPRVLLMDEPLSNLDARLRLDMREEIRRIQKRRGITTVYVTHDQEEAMAVSDRIAILRLGEVVQLGAPREVYFTPRTCFAAEFMGACNLLTVEAVSFDPGQGLLHGLVAGTPVRLRAAEAPAAGRLTVMLRPDWIEEADGQGDGRDLNRFEGTVASATFLGSSVTYRVQALGALLRVDVADPGRRGIRAEGDRIRLGFDPGRPVPVAP